MKSLDAKPDSNLVRYLGLTGGIATGKSTVAEMFRALGAAVIDADQVAREVVAPGSGGLEEIVSVFGPAVLASDGGLDREALARQVFAEPARRARLEAIVHPRVAAEAERRRRQTHARDPNALVVYDVPLLFEVGLAESFDRVIVVYAPRQVQVRRLHRRDNLTPVEAEQRLAAQMDIEEKARRADEVLDNTGTPEQLRRCVEQLFARLRSGTRDPQEED